MNKIKFNNTEYEVESYSKNTSFSGETIVSNAYCAIITDDVASLNTLAQTTITSIQIYHNEVLIYNLSDISAKIDSINEYLQGERMGINVNLTFSNT